MNRRDFIAAAALTGGAALTSCNPVEAGLLRKGETIHSVMFDLKHQSESDAERAFLEEGRRVLSAIPSVKGFQVFRQVSPKCDYSFGFSMVFESAEGYEAYNNHPDHVAFVAQRWDHEVSRFQEIDYVVY